MKKKIVIIDYQMSNIFSISNAIKYLGFDCEVTSDQDIIMSAHGAILPGVGAFSEAMNKIYDLDLVDVINNFIISSKPFMGICLGMHILFQESHEYGVNKGIGFFEGKVKFLANEINIKRVPHVGWNNIYFKKNKSNLSKNQKKIFHDLDYKKFYFVHSYYACPKNVDEIITTTNYQGFNFCSSISRKNVFACQFHPEKSGKIGLNLIKNFFHNSLV